MTLSDYKPLGRHVIVLCKYKNLCYCTVFALFYFVFEGTFQVQAPGGSYSEGPIHGGAIFGILRFVTIPSIALQTCVACILLGHYNSGSYS